MSQIPYIFNQLTCHIPRDIFDRLVRKHNGNAYVKKFSCWNHLLSMVWAQLTSRRSLRDIETSLRAHSDKTYRLGIGKDVSRSNLAHANARRDVAIYRGLAQAMMQKASRAGAKDGLLELIRRQFGLSGFFAIDSTAISLEPGKHPWSIPQVNWGGVKVHTMYDLIRKVPRMCLVTGHEERDQTFMEDYPYEKGCFYMFDKLYFKTRGFCRIESAGAYFVTRIKKKVLYEVMGKSSVSGNMVLRDDTIRLTGRWAKAGYPKDLRIISLYSVEKNGVIEFVTNNFALDAATIALLYQYRWQIELFFKWIKQHLRVVNFYGTSANAVLIQIYTAITSYCLLSIAADAAGFKGSLYEFANLMSVSLTEKRWIDWLVKRTGAEDIGLRQPAYPSLFDCDILPPVRMEI